MEKNDINHLINSDQKEVSKLYNANRDAFLNFGKKYGLSYDDLCDIYQEAFIALRKHALNGKLGNVNSSLKTYLFGIGKFMIYDLLKEKKKTTEYNPSKLGIHDTIELVSTETEEELSHEQILLQTYFKKLGKKCQDMLTLFYSRGLSIDEIVEHTDYTDGSVVRSQKSRCLKSLKDMIKA
ncbi:RNA polymerase sigma factor (sigma-70 family) [Mariniflexile fucanivorans]|uniref:RNA polymerase sigma factor (Sigma-70 family) n=1 Tax=Mariniflexile fucanivorans TaxID=264023 RepID=A0A4R1RQX0_9FLAO|nr:sigma-70 family RNA polymerase sigma factor [Mariniflexile fucanivorans]TCL68726.1 RNA polymerase sigma factor (sigma-70 family) [Mariniflexile fucanivorans]